MECGGNDVVNTIFEENLLNQSEKPSEDAGTSARQKFIQAKYKCRKYCAMSSRGLRPSALPNENRRGASGSGSMTNHSAVASRTIVQRLDKNHARRSETSDRSSDGAARTTSRSGAASQHTAVMPADVVMENSLVSPYVSQSSQALAETAMDTSQSTPGNMEIFVLLCMREASQGHIGKLTFQGRPDFFDLANRAVELFRHRLAGFDPTRLKFYAYDDKEFTTELEPAESIDTRLHGGNDHKSPILVRAVGSETGIEFCTCLQHRTLCGQQSLTLLLFLFHLVVVPNDTTASQPHDGRNSHALQNRVHQLERLLDWEIQQRLLHSDPDPAEFYDEMVRQGFVSEMIIPEDFLRKEEHTPQ
jgi:hypothetical protein